MNTHWKQYSSQDKVYLGQLPTLNNVVKNWLETIDVDHDCMGGEVEPLDCRSRNGFIAAGHNHGGFEKTWFTCLSYLHSTGNHLGFGDEADEAIEYNLKLAQEHCAEHKIADDDVRYEIEDEFMRDTCWIGVRCMYEGQHNGVHTLMVYVGGNISEYYGPFHKGSKTRAEYEIRFKTASGLRRQLNAITKRVQGDLE